MTRKPQRETKTVHNICNTFSAHIQYNTIQLLWPLKIHFVKTAHSSWDPTKSSLPSRLPFASLCPPCLLPGQKWLQENQGLARAILHQPGYPCQWISSQCAVSRNTWDLTSNKQKILKAAKLSQRREYGLLCAQPWTPTCTFALISPSWFSLYVKFHSIVYFRKEKGFKESCFAAILCAQHINLNIKYKFKLLRINLNLKID